MCYAKGRPTKFSLKLFNQREESMTKLGTINRRLVRALRPFGILKRLRNERFSVLCVRMHFAGKQPIKQSQSNFQF